MLTKTFLSFIVSFAILPLALGQSEITSPLHTDFSKAYGYCMGQKFRIEQIRQKFPEIADQARIAQLEFELVFKSSYENIENELRKLLGDKWDAYKSQLSTMATDTFEPSRFSEQDARAFVTEVSLRAKGEISSPVLETLLTYHPDFQSNPAEEYVRGFVETYRTKNHPKAKGVDFQIQYPKSWEAKEGQRPNVVQIITSKNGRGFDDIALTVKDIPIPQGYKITQAEINDLFTAKSLRETLPEKQGLWTEGDSSESLQRKLDQHIEEVKEKRQHSSSSLPVPSRHRSNEVVNLKMSLMGTLSFDAEHDTHDFDIGILRKAAIIEALQAAGFSVQ
jgi:hypothetical protein